MSAVKGKVDVFITGDKDFKEVNVEKPEILTPAEFVKKFPSGGLLIPSL